jgi:hypothetical protein
MRLGNVALSVVFTSLITTAQAATAPDVLAREMVGFPEPTPAAVAQEGVGQKKAPKAHVSPGKAAWDTYEKQIGIPLR